MWKHLAQIADVRRTAHRVREKKLSFLGSEAISAVDIRARENTNGRYSKWASQEEILEVISIGNSAPATATAPLLASTRGGEVEDSSSEEEEEEGQSVSSSCPCFLA